MPRSAPSIRNDHADVELAVDAYLAWTSDILARTLAASLATFAEPVVTSPDRALAIVGSLVETYAGFALGSIARAISTGVRRWSTDDRATSVLRGWQPSPPRRATGPRYLADAHARPLVDELGARLHPRLCAMAVDVRDLVGLAREQIASPRTFIVMLDLLRRDDAFAHRLGDELVAGWAHSCAAMTGAATPTGSAMWLAWSRRVRGEPEPGPRRGGYIMLVGSANIKQT